MPVHTKHQITESTWFITFTCLNWLPLFEVAQLYNFSYNWFKLIDEKHHIKTQAFVIMPNHVHLLLELTDEQVNLNTLIGNAKPFMAYEILDTLKKQGNMSLLNILAGACSEKEKAKGQLHKVFEPSFDARPVYPFDFLVQKINYIHHNPVSGKWNLADDYTKYANSSAAFYDLDEQHEFAVIDDYRKYWF